MYSVTISPVRWLSRSLLVGALAASGTLTAHPASAVPSEVHLYVPVEGVSHGSDIGVLVDDVPSPVATIHVNGIDQGQAPLVATMESGVYLVRYDRAWGMGTMHVVVDSVTSNTDAVRALTKVSDWKLRRIGPGARKLKITVRAVSYDPARNRMAGSKGVTLQTKNGKRWTKVRAIKVRKSGKGSVVFRADKARPYRLIVKQTTTVAGALHVMGGKI